MLIADIQRVALRRMLRRGGVHLKTGSFTTQLLIDLPGLVDEFAEMYAPYPVEDLPGIDDAHLRIGASSLVRRFFKPRAVIWMNGNKQPESVPGERAYPLLESAMNWVIASSDVAPLVIHAGVLERRGCALIMPAPSGSGKSTLTAALAWRGWRLLSDEMAAFDLGAGTLMPNPRPVSLKNRAIEVIAQFEPRARFSRTYRGTQKGNVAYMQPPPDTIALAEQSATPALVVAPAFRDGAATNLRAIDKLDGFRLLTENAVNYSSLLRTGFALLTGIARRCRFYTLTYSDLDSAIQVIDHIQGELLGSAAAP